MHLKFAFDLYAYGDNKDDDGTDLGQSDEPK
jgi:hypothetical protein